MNNFYALLSRMKYINRWSLMRQTRQESLSEHTLDTAIITHALIALANSRLGKELDPGKAVLYALYHDAAEIITGDMPTPVKYQNEQIREAYKHVESVAADRLLSILPEELVPHYEPLLRCDGDAGVYMPYIKAADKLSALVKCAEELSAGNHEFKSACKTLMKSDALKIPEAQIFLEECIPGYSLSLDCLTRGELKD